EWDGRWVIDIARTEPQFRRHLNAARALKPDPDQQNNPPLPENQKTPPAPPQQRPQPTAPEKREPDVPVPAPPPIEKAVDAPKPEDPKTPPHAPKPDAPTRVVTETVVATIDRIEGGTATLLGESRVAASAKQSIL